MRNIKYFFQFLLIVPLFVIFKLIGLNLASFIGGKLFEIIGPLFRSEKIIHSNIKKAFPNLNSKEINKITKQMWNNYGRVFSEYMFIKNYRNKLFDTHITIRGLEILREIKKNNKP